MFRLKEIIGIPDILKISWELRRIEKTLEKEINAQVKKYGYCDNLTPMMHFHVKKAAETLEQINEWPENTPDRINKS